MRDCVTAASGVVGPNDLLDPVSARVALDEDLDAGVWVEDRQHDDAMRSVSVLEQAPPAVVAGLPVGQS